MSARTVVIDYGIGNVFSVCNALRAIGADVSLTRSSRVIREADRLILPGVGAFGRAMEALNGFGLSEVIRGYVKTGKPFLGICIGMQVMMERSAEFGQHQGLALLKGTVERIADTNPAGARIRIPHIGWSSLRPESSLEGTPLAVAGDGGVYFVHSFHCQPVDRSQILATVDYDGVPVTAAIRQDNVVGVQFHPERSGLVGQRILRQFVLQGNG